MRNRGGLPAGYETGGIQRINSTYDTIRGNLTNRLAASGQSTAGGSNNAQKIVLGNLEGARGGSIADFQTSLPEVARQREMEDIIDSTMDKVAQSASQPQQAEQPDTTPVQVQQLKNQSEQMKQQAENQRFGVEVQLEQQDMSLRQNEQQLKLVAINRDPKPQATA